MRSEAAGIADSLDNNIRLQDYATETDIEPAALTDISPV